MLAGATYKLVCSNGSFWGPPSTVPAAIRPGGDKDTGIFRVLYNSSGDPSDMSELSHMGGALPMRSQSLRSLPLLAITRAFPYRMRVIHYSGARDAAAAAAGVCVDLRSVRLLDVRIHKY